MRDLEPTGRKKKVEIWKKKSYNIILKELKRLKKYALLFDITEILTVSQE